MQVKGHGQEEILQQTQVHTNLLHSIIGGSNASLSQREPLVPGEFAQSICCSHCLLQVVLPHDEYRYCLATM